MIYAIDAVSVLCNYGDNNKASMGTYMYPNDDDVMVSMVCLENTFGATSIGGDLESNETYLYAYMDAVDEDVCFNLHKLAQPDAMLYNAQSKQTICLWKLC